MFKYGGNKVANKRYISHEIVNTIKNRLAAWLTRPKGISARALCKSSKADSGRDREGYTWNRPLGSSPKSFLVPLLKRSASESASRLPDRYADSMDGPDACRQSREVKHLWDGWASSSWQIEWRRYYFSALPSDVEEGVNQSPHTATAWGPSMRKGAVCLFIGTAAPQSFVKKYKKIDEAGGKAM